MVKGCGQFRPSRGGKWFTHRDAAATALMPAGLPENKTTLMIGSEVGSRETCTSTGIMLTQVKSTVPQALQIERYPKWKSQQKSREYPRSEHDNKHALKGNVLTGVRRKPFEDRQHWAHFSLCHEGAGTKPGEDVSIFKSDYVEKQVSDPTCNRRFPRNHQLKSRQAAEAQGEDYFMWFGMA